MIILLFIDQAGRVSASHHAMKVVVYQGAFVSLAIREGEDTGSVFDPVLPLPLVLFAGGPDVDAVALAFAVHEVAYVFFAVGEFSAGLTVWQPVFPLSSEESVLEIYAEAVALGFSVYDLAFVDCTVFEMDNVFAFFIPIVQNPMKIILLRTF